ncbi:MULTISPECIES: DUF6020 family protein [Bifidobacterium]|uniref:Uncharacterized protein n=1 Tax=Bifidobacterium apousia TaxID=2750996 RepID=A0A556R5K8_9BIFI|nr:MULTISPECIES: DUF6020 family protein [Bifidobacterium]MBI0071347.1 hypothetical protein [Bifidobacterium sp. W8112]MBI0124341.1 hypothetical protein [Bifidobacterium apousia]MBI0137180.1 hypothetical protein [Bifidobacterium sp. W8120]TSJ84161.1 hypothetical protein FPK30_01470 [Bifidobacterium apousia]
MSADSGRTQPREAGEQPVQTSALQTGRPGSRASRAVGLVLALLACLWIAFCTGLGPIYRQEGSLTQVGLAQVLIMLGTLAICLALVLACRRILLGGAPLRMSQRLTSLAQRPRMRAYAVFITRQTSGWRPIMRLLLLGWAWAFLTLLAAYGADLYAQAQECANFLAQLQGDQPPYGGNAFTQMDVYPIGHYLLPGHPVFLTDQHNMVLTLVYGMTIMASNHLTGSYDAGIVLLAGLQVIFAAFCCAVTADRFLRGSGTEHVGALARTLVMLFFLCSPFVVFSTFSLTKSPLFAFAFIWWFGIWRQLESGDKDSPLYASQAAKLRPGLALSTLIMLISAKYALYIVLVQLVLALIIRRRQWATILIGLLLPLVLFTGVTGALTATGTVIQGDPVESRSIQLQQIARVAQRNPQGIPAQARADLEPIMDLDNAAIQYTPWEADRVKSSGNQPKLIVYRWRTVTPEQISRLNRAWLQVGLRNPVIYLDAFMAEAYGYFDPGDPAYVAMSYYLNNGYVQNSGSWLAAWCHDWRNGVTGFVRTWADTPLLGLVARANFWVVAALLLIVARLAAGHWRGVLCWFPLLLIMGVMITAPANNFERHMLPVDMVVPFLILDMVRQSRRARAENLMDRPS